MIDEHGNRAADPKATIIVENGIAWLRTIDGRLHMIGGREDLFQHATMAFRRLEGMLRNEVYRPPSYPDDYPPSAFDV